MSTPLVSVIMPAYNAEKTIADAIQSVIGQTFQNWELIIVNDGSRDKTVDVIDLTDQRIRLLNQPNEGVASARNHGIRQSTGQYIAFLDSDDVWAREKLEKQIEWFHNIADKNNLGLIHTSYKCFVDNITNSFIKENYPSKYLKIANKYYKLLVHCDIGTSTVMVKKSVLNDIGLFDSMLNGTEDWDLWIRIAQKYDFIKIEFPLAFYRENSTGLSKNRERHFSEELKVIKKHTTTTTLIPRRIQQLSLWFLNIKKANYYFQRRKVLKSIQYFCKALLINPFDFNNIFVPLNKIIRSLTRLPHE